MDVRVNGLHNPECGSFDKGIDKLIPDFRDCLHEMEQIEIEETEEGKYYIESLGGLILKSHMLAETIHSFYSYDIDQNGILFWDYAPGILERDLQTGRTQLYKLPEELIRELNLENVVEFSSKITVSSLWLRKLQQRSTKEANIWLADIVEEAMSEYIADMRITSKGQETGESFVKESIYDKVVSIGSAVRGYRDYTLMGSYNMLEFEAVNNPCANRIMVNVLEKMYHNKLGEDEWFLIYSSKSRMKKRR